MKFILFIIIRVNIINYFVPLIFIGGPTVVNPTPTPQSGLGLDLLGGGLDGIFGGPDTGSSAPVVSQSTTGLLGDIFGFNQGPTPYVTPRVNWLPAEKGKGFDIWGTFSRKYVI